MYNKPFKGIIDVKCTSEMKHLLEQKSNVTQLITCLSATALCVIILLHYFAI